MSAPATAPCAPWPRRLLDAAAWQALDPAALELHALWADTLAIHAVFTDAAGAVLPCSVPVAEGHYPALSPRFPAALSERAIRDLWGHECGGDLRPLLDHGQWRFSRPMAPRHEPPGAPPFEPLAVPGATMQWPIGPVTGAPAEPVHLRAHLADGRVQAVEARLGYAHKGTLLLMRGKSPRAAARFAARLSADATVAHALAFARAAEAALGVEPPPRAVVLRAVMAELERIATHLGDLAAACPRLARRYAASREAVLAACAATTGHRMMMDCVVPGGLVADIAGFPELALDVPAPEGGEGIGPVPPGLLHGAPGLAARAAGRPVDARAAPGYPPYAGFTPLTREGGDVAARLQLRADEIAASLALVRSWLAALPSGPVSLPLPGGSGEGLAAVETPRGAAWHWLRLDGGLIASAFAADPSWRLWPLQEAASVGAAPEDLALIDRSFACARSGTDL